MNGLVNYRCKRRAGRSSLILISGLMLGSCQSKPLEQKQAPQAQPEEPSQAAVRNLVTVGKTAMHSGFAISSLRVHRTVSGFRIDKHPVTWMEYDACVARGQCPPADSAACAPWSYSPYGLAEMPPYATKSERGPAVCVGQAQAETYCKSVGGRLPRLNEWLVAARGEEVKRFSWGDTPQGCDQHPFSPLLVQRTRRPRSPREPVNRQALLQRAAILQPVGAPADLAGSACDQRMFDGSELFVGGHPKGVSPYGLEDVLLAPGELLKSDDQSPFNACSPPFEHCVVFGIKPAAIDSVETFAEVPATSGAERRITIGHAYAFRCAFDPDTSG